MRGFPEVVYIRVDGPEKNGKSPFKAGKFQADISKVGKKIKGGVYGLMSIVDIASKPEPKKKDTEKTVKPKTEKGEKN